MEFIAGRGHHQHKATPAIIGALARVGRKLGIGAVGEVFQN